MEDKPLVQNLVAKAISTGRFVLMACGLGFFLTFLFTEDLRNVALGLFGLAGLFLLIFRRGLFTSLQPEARILILGLAVFFLVALASWFWGGMPELGSRKLGRVINVLFFAPFLAAFIVARPRPEWIWAAMALGGIVAGICTAWALGMEGQQRITGGSHTMTVGGLSLAAGFALLAALPFLWKAGYRWLAALVLAGAAGYVATNLGSGVRGPWLALPVLVLAWLGGTLWLQRNYRQARLGLAGLALVLLVVLPFAPHLDRFGTIQKEWALWQAGEKVLPERDQRGAYDCLAHPDWLAFWREHAQVSGDTAALETRTEPWTASERLALAERSCWGEQALRLTNTADQQLRLQMPRRAVARDAEGSAFPVVVSGGGGVDVINGESEPVRAHPHGEYHVFAGGPSARLELLLEPGESLRVIPLEARPGELMYFHAAGPVAERLEMWRAGLDQYTRAPLLGHGLGSFPGLLAEAIAERRASPAAAGQAHPHNEWLYALSSRGIPGLVALAALFVVPLAVFYQLGRQGTAPVRAASLAAGGFVVTTAVFGLTQGIFDHNLMVNAYTFLVATCFYLAVLPRLSARPSYPLG